MLTPEKRTGVVNNQIGIVLAAQLAKSLSRLRRKVSKSLCFFSSIVKESSLSDKGQRACRRTFNVSASVTAPLGLHGLTNTTIYSTKATCQWQVEQS